MTTVDPYVVRIPQTVMDSGDRELIGWYEYDNRWKHDLWKLVTGGTGGDETGGIEESSANENQISYNFGLIQQLLQRVEDLENDIQPQLDFTRNFNNITKDVNYTAVDWDFVNVKAGSEITLPSSPEENSVIIIRNGDGTAIKINPNGRTINGETSAKIVREGTALFIHYFIDTNEWLVR